MLEQELDRRLPGCSVHAARQDGIPVVAVTGEVDIATAPLVGAELARQLERSPATLVVDLREVTYFDSSGISVLLVAHRRAADLRVIADQTVVLKPLRLSAMDTVFRIHPTVSAALERPAA